MDGMKMMFQALGLDPEKLMTQFQQFQTTIVEGLKQVNQNLSDIKTIVTRHEKKFDAWLRTTTNDPPENLSIFTGVDTQKLMNEFDPTNPTRANLKE